jgi:general secretion pathway protein N
LVGAIAADGEGIAVFVDESTRGVVRLKTGEGHSGWILRTVTGREATLQRDQEIAVFAIANAPAK